MKTLSAVTKIMLFWKALEISRTLTSRLEEAAIFNRTRILSMEVTGE
jgi:hypothetical protein